MDSEAFERGNALVQQAVEAERGGQLDKAYEFYKNGMNNYFVCVRFESDQQKQVSLLNKMKSYQNRLEELQKQLHRSKSNTKIPEKKKKSAQDMELRLDPEHFIKASHSEKKWKDVAGMQDAVRALTEAIILPKKMPQLFVGERKPWASVLLYGPPGTGKTFLAKVLASECKSTFLEVSAADLVSKWQGDSEKGIKQLFRIAQERAPCILFFDEVDSIGGSRDSSDGESGGIKRMVSEFLTQMNAVLENSDVKKQIFVLGATNYPWLLDAALRRRFEHKIYVGLPDLEARLQILRNHIGKTPHILTPQDFEEVAGATERYSGADIASLVKAVMYAPLNDLTSSNHFFVQNDIYSVAPFCESCIFTELGDCCEECGALTINFDQIPADKIEPPPIEKRHLLEALRQIPPSPVSHEKYEEFKLLLRRDV